MANPSLKKGGNIMDEQLFDCPHCGARDIRPTGDMKCSNCQGQLSEVKERVIAHNISEEQGSGDDLESSNKKESQVIKPSGFQMAWGIGMIVSALFVALGSIVAILQKIPLNSQPDGNFILAEFLGVLTACCLAAWVGFYITKTIVVDEMLKELDSEDYRKRKKAAGTLMMRKWEPTSITQKVKLLVASEKYKEAVTLDKPMATERMVDTLKIDNVSVGKEIFASFVKMDCQNAIPLLIELMAGENTAVSKRQIVKTLEKLTGQNFGNDDNQWNIWFCQEYDK